MMIVEAILLPWNEQFSLFEVMNSVTGSRKSDGIVGNDEHFFFKSFSSSFLTSLIYYLFWR